MEQFQQFNNIMVNPSTYDFPDRAWAERPAIVLQETPDNVTITLGRSLMRGLAGGEVSIRDVGSIFLIAFQLKRPGNGHNARLLPAVDELRLPTDKNLGELDDYTSSPTPRAPIRLLESAGASEVARGYAFIAASMLRMFGRSPENYARSWSHIMRGYRNFYNTNMPISGAMPLPGALRQIHNTFSNSLIMKASLYRFLYHSNQSGSVTDLQTYLYDSHLLYTGMQVVPIVDKLCTATVCSLDTLVKLIHIDKFSPQCLGLEVAFSLMKSDDWSHMRRLWKYGRIFESSFLSALRTKTCVMLVYTLACALKRECPEGNEGILNLKQFEDIPEERKRMMEERSRLLLDALHRRRYDMDMGILEQGLVELRLRRQREQL